MHVIYHFTKRNGELPGEFIVISELDREEILEEYENREYYLYDAHKIEGDALSLPTDRRLMPEY